MTDAHAGEPVERLRAAMGALPAVEDAESLAPGDTGFDPAEHADRFEAVHEALVAVLADLDRG